NSHRARLQTALPRFNYAGRRARHATAPGVTPIDHTATSTHPLDPLSPDELERSVVALGSRVISVDLLEPDKAALRAWREGGAVPQREALAVVLDIGGEGRECTIALDSDTISD